MVWLKLAILTTIAGFAVHCGAEKKVVCYYDSRSHYREGQAKFEIVDIEAALQYCTHLVYGYAAIKEDTFKATPLNEQFDVIKDNYRKVTDLKKRFPKVKFLLSIGGNADISGEDSEKNLKYRTLLETSTHRLAFVNSAYTLVKGFGFDGVDLAWEFPENKPKKIRSGIGSFWHSLKKKVGATSVIDENAEAHKEQFVSLVREMRNALQAEKLLLTLTVLPNVNSTVYYDVRNLAPYIDFANLFAFDFYTPERNPKEADYPAPLYELIDRRPDENVDAQVRYWLTNGCPSDKVVVGIPTYSRTWTMTDESNINGTPPIIIDGPGESGPYTRDAGLLSFPEVCNKISQTSGVKTTPISSFKKVQDSSKRSGTFVFRLHDENNNAGLWIGYEDLDSISTKGNYVKAKGLGGVAVVDLSLDDFHGTCGRDKFDVLKAAAIQL